MSIVKSLRDWRAARNTARELNTLTNAQLIDMGIYRGDINTIARNLR